MRATVRAVTEREMGHALTLAPIGAENAPLMRNSNTATRRFVAGLLLSLAAVVAACAPATQPTSSTATNASPIARSTDTSVAMPYDFVAIDFVDAARGWIVGVDEGNNVSTILRTEDGGATWTQLVEVVGDTLYDVDFADEREGWAAGIEGVVYRTSDGGATWAAVPAAALEARRTTPFKRVRAETGPALLELSETVVSIVFLDETTGLAAGDTPGDDIDARRRLLLRTSDGGRTWTDVPAAGPETDVAINDLAFASASDGWAAGGNVVTREEDVLLHTADGGRTWERRRAGSAQFHRAVHFADPMTGWVVGLTIDPVDETFGPSRILQTTDGGRTWAPQLTSDRSFFDVTFFDSKIGWAVGDRAAVFSTTDGGATWTQQTRFANTGVTQMSPPPRPPNAPMARSLNVVTARGSGAAVVGGAGVILTASQ